MQHEGIPEATDYDEEWNIGQVSLLVESTWAVFCYTQSVKYRMKTTVT